MRRQAVAGAERSFCGAESFWIFRAVQKAQDICKKSTRLKERENQGERLLERLLGERLLIKERDCYDRRG